MKNISATKYSTYEKCQLQYKYNYVLKLIQMPSVALELGKLYHKCTEEYHSNVPVDVIEKNIEDSLLADKDKIILSGMIQKYIENPVEGNVLEKEMRFDLDIPGLAVPVIGYIDRVDEDKGVEYKTSSFDYKVEDADTIQAEIYIYALWKKFGKLFLQRYSINNKTKFKSKKYVPQIIDITKTEEDMLKLEKKLIKFYNDVQTSRFEPSPGTHCYWCPWGNKGGDGTCPYSK